MANDATNNKVYEVRMNGVKALDGATADNYTQQFAVGAGVTPTLSIPADYDAGANDKIYPGISGATVKMATSNDADADADRTLTALKVTLNFNGRAMNASTVTTANVKLVETDSNYVEKTGTDVAGTITYDTSSFTATFTPTAALKDNTYYKFTTTTAIKDANGIASVAATPLTFITGDFTAPTVASTNVDTGNKLSDTTKLKVAFSEKMDITNRLIAAVGAFNTIDAQHSVTLHDDSANAYVQVDIALDAADTTGKTVTFIKNGNWAINKTYTLKIKGKNYSTLLSGCDLAGNPIPSDYTVTFTTADSAVPQVTAVKGFANGYTGALPNKELLGSTANSVVVGLEESNGATAAQEAIYVYFNRIVDDAADNFLTVTNYQLSTDGGAAADLAAPVALVPGWVASFVADANGNNTIVKLLPTQSTTTTNDASSIIAGEHKYVLTIKKDTALSDGKKLADAVNVYYATEAEKPALAAVSSLQTYNAATAGALADVGATTKASWANRGLAITFADAGSGNTVLISSLTSDTIKVQDVTADAIRTGAFYEDITNGDAKTLLSSTAGAATANATIYWYPASDADKFVAGHQYKITISGVKDAVGNAMATPAISYATIADTSAPTVASTTVTNGQENVSVDPSFNVVFSKNVSTTLPDATTITLTKVGGAAVPCVVTYTASTKTAVVAPQVYLDKLAQYVLHIDNTIADATASLGADTDITFMTENVTKTQEITSAVWDSTAKTITISVNKPIKAGTTVDAADIITGATLVTPTISVSLDRKTIVVKLDENSSVLPGVHVVSFLTGGANAVPEAGAYKQIAVNAAGQTTTNSITIVSK